ncbi:MAG: hypothetical protein WC220_11685 [Pedobacter sp.]|jgi:hypothetical protein
MFFALMNNGSGNNTPKHYLLLFLAFVIPFSYSCTNPGKDPESLAAKNDSIDSILRKPPSSFKDTVSIGFPAAVFYNTDKRQSEKFIETNGKKVFESIQHDCFYQMKYSREVLNKYYPGVRLTELTNARYLQFKKADSEYTIIDLNNYELCGMFIFDGHKAPLLVDMTNVDTQLGFYFSNR